MIAEVVVTQWVAAVCLAKKSGPVPGPIWSTARPGSKEFVLTAFCNQTLRTRDQRGNGFEPHQLHCVVSLSKTY